jgi:cell division protein FtsW
VSGRRRRAPRPGWPPVAILVVVLTVVLLLFGLLMGFSASFVGAAIDGDAFGTFRRQLVWSGLGLPMFWLAGRVPRPVLRRLAWPGLALAVAGLVLVLVPGVGVERFGSTRWLGVGEFVFQPSEAAKLLLLVWLADVLERKRPRDGSLHSTEHLLIPALPVLGAIGLLVMLQPDLGTTLLLAAVVALVLWVEGLRMGFFLAGIAGAGALAALLTLGADYRSARIRGWLDPEAYALGEGFQLMQSWVALGSGGLLGLGPGSSRGKWNYLPNPGTDFVFAIIGEELGLVGAGTVLLLFLVLLGAGLHVAAVARPGFDRTTAFAVTGLVVGQALLNIATVIGLLPITGVTLPLVSAGGSSLVVTLAALGILVGIARDPAPAPVVGRQRRASEVG